MISLTVVTEFGESDLARTGKSFDTTYFGLVSFVDTRARVSTWFTLEVVEVITTYVRSSARQTNMTVPCYFKNIVNFSFLCPNNNIISFFLY